MATETLAAWLPSVASTVGTATSTVQMVGACLLWLRYLRLVLPEPGRDVDLDDRLFHMSLALLGLVGTTGFVSWMPWWLSTLVVVYTSLL
jgi:hypothetical protein